MKFAALALATIASFAGYVAGQEAARFGYVSVENQSENPLKIGDSFTVHYNHTLARYEPKYLDVYIQGTIERTNYVLPYVLLQRSEYPAGAQNVYFNVTLPQDGALQINGTNYLVWAFITFPSDSSNPNSGLEVAGTSTTINIDTSGSVFN